MRLGLVKLETILKNNPDYIGWVNELDESIELIAEGRCETYHVENNNFQKAKNMIVDEIKNRTNQINRVESWECTDYQGNYSEKMYWSLVERRKN